LVFNDSHKVILKGTFAAPGKGGYPPNRGGKAVVIPCNGWSCSPATASTWEEGGMVPCGPKTSNIKLSFVGFLHLAHHERDPTETCGVVGSGNHGNRRHRAVSRHCGGLLEDGKTRLKRLNQFCGSGPWNRSNTLLLSHVYSAGTTTYGT
jgi:hypothetical protein